MKEMYTRERQLRDGKKGEDDEGEEGRREKRAREAFMNGRGGKRELQGGKGREG